MSDVPPGRCGALAPGHMQHYSCELLAGHAGMHQANDWSGNTETQLRPPMIVAWTDRGGDGGPRREDPRIARVSAIHVEYGRDIPAVAHSYCLADGDPWPCPTIRALDDPQDRGRDA